LKLAFHPIRAGNSEKREDVVKHEAAFGGLLKDHRQVQVHARRLQKVVSDDEADPASAARSLLAFWQSKASILFRKEEDVLLPVLARYGGTLWEEPVARLLTGHTRIKGLVMELVAEFRPQMLRSLGERLESYVRLEERAVFSLLEEVLPERALEEMTSRLEAFEAGPRPWVAAGACPSTPTPALGTARVAAGIDPSRPPYREKPVTSVWPRGVFSKACMRSSA
jgi:hypothetical protein